MHVKNFNITLISKLHLTFKPATNNLTSQYLWSPLFPWCKLSSIDFQKKLEQQFYKDITNTSQSDMLKLCVL